MLLKALALRSIDEIPKIQEDVTKKTIIILKVTPLAQKSVDELKSSVEQLYEFATAIGGDIARLGDERVVITPPGVKIWRGLQ
ncbi:MAG: cell division protein SepF [Thaumarchaeota archaeon]|nr:MAG: cell division protein SepF [Nitrososphaerota archaeon]TLX98525.1 MAG: cell division protein SepF [Nitrososphaerota archaeon]TLX99503.1 MAG: cell division protein SepF [Nitrososphaerota archaeon]TLX99562.1 MAG: cell division protein SepF [Nitrososphaerota archaeon]TLY17025.1 MAG: cell division protein SepF [Nitrososphaerota archaeon]